MEYIEKHKPTTSLLLPVQIQPVDRPVVASALNGYGSVNPSFDGRPLPWSWLPPRFSDMVLY
jgi:hypothetical protein